MTDFAMDYRNEQQPRRKRRRRFRPGRVLLVITCLTLLILALLFLVYKLTGLQNPGELPPLRRDSVSLRQRGRNNLPAELQALLESNPETFDFVNNYDENRVPLEEIDISGDVSDGRLPLFLQWDERWGYDTYGSGMLAITGCGPTCLSMVAVGLTGDLALNPRAVADFAAGNGYYAAGSGTEWTLMTDGAARLGLSSRVLSLHEPTILAELRAGNPIICSVGSGDFTTDGHYIVLTGMNPDGTVSVNDPNSVIRSEADWELVGIMRQVKNLWVFVAESSQSKKSGRIENTDIPLRRG